jgi:RNA polymerase sigma-70 factor, ECF subfamily
VQFGQPPPIGDEEFVTLAMRGDADAFDELVRRHHTTAVLAARPIVGALFAEDVAQEAFFLAFKSLRTLDDPAKFAQWLRVIVRREAVRFKGRPGEARRGKADPEEVPDAATAEPGADGLCELLFALEQVPSQYAAVLRLHFLTGIPLEQISKTLQVPVSTVKWRIHMGKNALRELLNIMGRPVEGAQEWLKLALRRLPRDCATILSRHAVEGVPLSQIAEDLRVPESRVERRLQHGRKRLRQELIALGHELGRASGKPLAWIPCQTCQTNATCLSAACCFSPRYVRKSRPIPSQRRKAR